MGIITKYKNLGLKSLGLLAIVLFLLIFMKGIVWYSIALILIGVILGINIVAIGDKLEKTIEDKTSKD